MTPSISLSNWIQLFKRPGTLLYVSVQNIGHMVASEYSGWWDDIHPTSGPHLLQRNPKSWQGWREAPSR